MAVVRGLFFNAVSRVARNARQFFSMDASPGRPLLWATSSARRGIQAGTGATRNGGVWALASATYLSVEDLAERRHDVGLLLKDNCWVWRSCAVVEVVFWKVVVGEKA